MFKRVESKLTIVLRMAKYCRKYINFPTESIEKNYGWHKVTM